ncbi:MAG: hypothetical protein AAFP70_10940 [Calditrichota bacterium]
MNTAINPKVVRIAVIGLSLLLLIAGRYYFEQREAAEQPEIIKAPYFPRLDLGVSIPVDVKFNLLNNPQKIGDVAELELMFTSRLDDATVSVAMDLPDAVTKQSGASTWSGKLNNNETKRMQIAVQVNSEAPQSVSAQVTLEKGDLSVTRGAAYHLDMGTPDHVIGEETPIQGYQGGDKLNIIVPRNKQQ